MLTVLSLITIKQHTGFDSVRIDINKLHTTIDSLQKVISKDNIASEYFHDILTTQFEGFVLLVTIIFTVIGIVSWRSIIIPFKKETGAIKLEFDNQIKLQKKEFDKFNAESLEKEKAFEEFQNKLSAKINFALYHVAKVSNDPENAIGWNIDSVISFLKIGLQDKAIDQLKDLKEILQEEKFDSAILKENDNKFRDCIMTIKEYEIEGIISILNDIEDLYYTIVYNKLKED